MKNVTPKAGQVWEYIKYKVKLTKVTHTTIEHENEKTGYKYVDSMDDFLSSFKFIPQSDLEWLAVKYDKWKEGANFLTKESQLGDCGQHIFFEGEFWKSKELAMEGAVTRQEHQNMRYDLGLDEKPINTEARDFCNNLDINMMEKETKMKAKIQKVELFNIEINGVTHKGFEKVESWKGLACYKNKDGEIIANDFGAKTPFDWISFPSDGKAEPQEIIIVSASPCFIKEQNK